MEKYLGNKRILLPAIFEFVNANCPDAKSVFDVFAGTTNVGRFFRKKGFDVLSNDINRFSYVLGSTYLNLSKPLLFNGLPRSVRTHSAKMPELQRAFQMSAKRDGDQLFPLSKTGEIWEEMYPAACVLSYLNSIQEKNKKTSAGLILKYYTVFGDRSDYESQRGTKGKRNYFSQENAKKLDLILECVRAWWKEKLLTPGETLFLLTSILEEVTLVANVNGTFHDFNREKLWPNSMQTLFLRMPLAFASNVKAQLFRDDALKISKLVSPHDILYIDPPYNFRQYTAYYHFLNFIAGYPFLPSVENYLSGIEFVRGQNMKDDFTSDFCFKDKFIPTLRQLIANTPSKYVVMSYYGGRNHWNHWSKGVELHDEGYQRLSEVFFDQALFKKGSSKPVIELRQNYQSRIGEQKKMVDEYLFFGAKYPSRAVKVSKVPTARSSAAISRALGLNEIS